MAWRRLLTQVAREESRLGHFSDLYPRALVSLHKYPVGGVKRFIQNQERFQSSYVGNLARRVRDADGANDTALLKELYRRNDPEAVIRLFESQPSLQSNPSAVAEYVKALVKVDRLDESELLRTLQRVLEFIGTSERCLK